MEMYRIQALIDNPENFGFALANYEHTVEVLRYQCFETAGTDDYVQMSLILDQMKIMVSICRLVHDIEFFEEEADHD